MPSSYKLINVPLNMVDSIMSSKCKPVNVPLNMVDFIMSSRYKPVNVPCNEGQKDIYTVLQPESAS